MPDLDALSIEDATVVVPSPAGEPFTQALARDLATRERLVFACGRYEGIDQRVVDHAASRTEVREISLGDYVLNGGEVAALAIAEAVVRLLPGFMGNAESLAEESHEEGLLEAPAYTKPPSWRGLDVPDVLRSGDHAAIAAWRHDAALRRTAARRPDLVAASQVPGTWSIEPAVRADAGELLVRELVLLPVDESGSGHDVLVLVRERQHRAMDLAHLRTVLDGGRVATGLRQGGEQKTDEQRDDRDDHEQLDEREAAVLPEASDGMGHGSLLMRNG